MTRLRWISLGALLLSAMACHGEVEMTPLIDRKIYLTDKFYDVEAISPEKAIIVGYGGKILSTGDGGRNWEVVPSGTDGAIYKVKMVDDANGWAVGQAGIVLKTTDGGKSWQKVDAGTQMSLFSVYATSPERMIAVGERATIVSTSDGGATWTTTKLESKPAEAGSDEAMVGLNDADIIAQDPALYDVQLRRRAARAGSSASSARSCTPPTAARPGQEQQQSLVGERDLRRARPADLLRRRLHRRAATCVAAGLEARIARTTRRRRDLGVRARSTRRAFDLDPLFDRASSSPTAPAGPSARGRGGGSATGGARGSAPTSACDVFTWLRAGRLLRPEQRLDGRRLRHSSCTPRTAARPGCRRSLIGLTDRTLRQGERS